MIHTILADKVDELDRQVNDFMRQKKRNLPVRTESYVVEMGNTTKVIQKATIFYDENFNVNDGGHVVDNGQETYSEELVEEEKSIHQEEPEKKKSAQIGALWFSKDGKTLTGKCNNESTAVPENITAKIKQLQNGDKYPLIIKKVDTVIIRNKFKESTRHPDFVIYPKRE